MALGRQVHKGNSDWISTVKDADAVWGDRKGDQFAEQYGDFVVWGVIGDCGGSVSRAVDGV